MEAGFKQILEELKQLEDKNVTDVFVPSSNKYVPCKTLNMHDQKSIIKTAIDTSSTNIEFNINVNKLLYRLMGDNATLLVTDKPALLMSLRANNIDKEIDVESDNDRVKINLNQLISKYETIVEQSSIEYKTKITHDQLSIKLRVPDLKTDIKFLQECKKNVKAAASVDIVSDNISEMYVYELAKFIESVQYTSSESPSAKMMNTAIFNNIDAKNCVEVVGMLPITINKQIVKYIKRVREFEDQFHSVGGVVVPLDATLFTID